MTGFFCRSYITSSIGRRRLFRIAGGLIVFEVFGRVITGNSNIRQAQIDVAVFFVV